MEEENESSSSSLRSPSPLPSGLKKSNSNKKFKTETERKRQYRMYLMKDSLKRSTKIPIYRIPEYKFKKAINMLNDTSFIPKLKSYEKSCTPPIYAINTRKRDIVTSNISKLLVEARKCLLKRDWVNLGKILYLAKPIDTPSYEIYFDVLKKYAEICLIHNPNDELLKNFKQGILSSNNYDIDDIRFNQITKKFDNYDYNKNDEMNESDITIENEDDCQYENDYDNVNDDENQYNNEENGDTNDANDDVDSKIEFDINYDYL